MAGHDIAVYHLYTLSQDFRYLGQVIKDEDDKDFDTKKNVWPICLPKNDAEYENNPRTGEKLEDGFVVGWLGKGSL